MDIKKNRNKFLKTFNKKKVLVTGHTGFKGSWLTFWLNELGANIIGVSKGIPTRPSNYKANDLNKKIKSYDVDITKFQKLNNIIKANKPDYVFHLAAQSLVKKSYNDPIQTWKTNLLGTVNVLESLTNLKNNCIAVIITSDKCYDNVEWEWGYRENDRLGGPDPYSASKGAAEIAISSYIRSYFEKDKKNIKIASARAGNVIGGGDWAEDRIIPDCIKSWSKSKSVKLRNPNSTRPWQHVLEPLGGYLQLAIKMSENSNILGKSFNFGPSSDHNYTVKDLVKKMSTFWEKVSWIDASSKSAGPYESNLLKLNCDRALQELSWKPTLDFHTTVKFTAEWYKKYYEDKKNISQITREQIFEFMKLYKINTNDK